MEDAALLQEYARTESELAFAALVERYIGLVYSVRNHQQSRATDVFPAVYAVTVCHTLDGHDEF